MSEQGTRRIPPYSMEAEQSVLGSMLLDQNAVIAAMETLVPEDFYVPGHQVIFDAMGELYRNARPIDLVTLVDVLETHNNLERAGGMEYVTGLSGTVPTTTNIGNYVAIVEDRSALRNIITAGSGMVDAGFRADRPSMDVVSDAHDAIYDIITRRRTDSMRPIIDALDVAVERLAIASQAKGGIIGTPTGYADLDYLTSGFSPDQLIVLAARPGMGKSSLALNMAHNIGVKQNMPVAIFSLEMSIGDLAMRMMCSEAEVPLTKARSGQYTDEEYVKLLAATSTLSPAPIYMDESGGATVTEIRSKCMRLSAKAQLGLIIIDYLQLMSGTGGRRSESRQQEISELTRSLKVLSRDVGAPVLVLSQLNRDIERRANKRPTLADLRESGSIEQDADMVIFLAYDRDLRGEDEDDYDDPVREDLAYAILAKNRNGPTGDVPLIWRAEYTKFVAESPRQEI
ncbi:replicative DNA helicase [Eubacteriales bacterium OttesenSCG-928-M02]|nr:replicative DNA helicase [Eubacteriales bacterium OttesenSCG-928-M02]